MRNYDIRYKAAGILLLFSLLILSACSKEELIEETPGVSSIPESPAAEIPLETPAAELETLEPEQVEPEATEPVITPADWESYFDGINGTAVIYSPSENSYQIYN